MTEFTTFAQLAGQYGFPLVLCIFLIVYVFKSQKCQDTKTDARETKAAEREANYQKYIDTLKNQILTTACDNNNIVKTISGDVDILDDKVNGVNAKVDLIDRKMDQAINKLDTIHQKI